MSLLQNIRTNFLGDPVLFPEYRSTYHIFTSLFTGNNRFFCLSIVVLVYMIAYVFLHFSRSRKFAVNILPYISGCILLYTAYLLQRIFETRNNILDLNSANKANNNINNLIERKTPTEQEINAELLSLQNTEKDKSINSDYNHFKDYIIKYRQANSTYNSITSDLKNIQKQTLESLCNFEEQFRKFVTESEKIDSKLKSIEVNTDGLNSNYKLYKESVLAYFNILEWNRPDNSLKVNNKTINIPQGYGTTTKANLIINPIVPQPIIVQRTQTVSPTTPEKIIRKDTIIDKQNNKKIETVSKTQFGNIRTNLQDNSINKDNNLDDVKINNKEETELIKDPELPTTPKHKRLNSKHKRLGNKDLKKSYLISSNLLSTDFFDNLSDIYVSKFSDFLPHLSFKAPQKYSQTSDYLLYLEMFLIVQGIICFLIFLTETIRNKTNVSILRTMLSLMLVSNVLLAITSMIHAQTLEKRCLNRTVDECSFSSSVTVDDYMKELSGLKFNIPNNYDDTIDRNKTFETNFDKTKYQLKNIELDATSTSKDYYAYISKIMKSDYSSKSKGFSNLFSKLKFVESNFEAIVEGKVNKNEYYNMIRQLELNLNNIEYQIKSINFDEMLKNMSEFSGLGEFFKIEQNNFNSLLGQTPATRKLEEENIKCKNNVNKVCQSYKIMDEIFGLMAVLGLTFSLALLF